MVTPKANKTALWTALTAVVCCLITGTHSRECSILAVHGANGKTGTGFGISTNGDVPRTGTSGDAGADATSFTTGSNPNPVCGKVAKLEGNTVNITLETQEAIANGLPTVYSNGSIPLTVFQVNRPGGGPMSCEYSPDATGNSWKPMDVTLNMPGNFGEENAVRVQYMVVATLRDGAGFTGGASGNVGLVRCRAGYQLQCGGCFAVQMEGTVAKATGSTSRAVSVASTDTSGATLTSQQMSTVMAKVVEVATAQGLTVSA